MPEFLFLSSLNPSYPSSLNRAAISGISTTKSSKKEKENWEGRRI